jgi:ABC-type bacteriocin/lantibiotic exporter with double-glycine peptidase domain
MSNASNETPEPSLTLPHFKQSERYTCLPACARMVLAFYGDEQDEAELERLFSTTSSGSHEEDVERLRE